MKKFIIIVFIFFIIALIYVPKSFAYDYGDRRSYTLLSKAWQALDHQDYRSAIAYTNKCEELYGKQAARQQSILTDYVTGKARDVLFYWQLNDVGTALFIKAEALRLLGFKKAALNAYIDIVEKYNFSQCWYPGGFWKPANEAREKISFLNGDPVALADDSPKALMTKAWRALNREDLQTVFLYTDECLKLYEQKAVEMHEKLVQSNQQDVEYYDVLNGVATAYFIRAEASRLLGRIQDAEYGYNQVIDKFYFARCLSQYDEVKWDLKPVAQSALNSL